MNEPYRLRYANQIVGTSLLLLLVSVVVIGVVLTRASGYFTVPDLVELQLSQSQVSSLQKGTEIVQLGQRIGQVKDLKYIGDSDFVTVTLAINPKYRGMINADSQVAVERKFGIGVPILKISRQHKNVPPPSSLDTPEFTNEVDQLEQMGRNIEEVRTAIQKIQAKLDPTLTKVGGASEATEQAMSSMEKTSDDVRPKTIATLDQFQTTTVQLERQINQLSEQVRQLIENDIKTTIGSIHDSAEAATEAADSVAHTSKQLDENRKRTSREISATLKTLQETAFLVQTLTNETREVVRIVRQEANDLPGTTERINDTVEQTQELVGEIQSHWLLRRYHDPAANSEQVSPPTIPMGGIR